MRTLVTGAGGQVGVELVRVLRARGGEVHAATRETLDVTDGRQVEAALAGLRPDQVINLAAWTAVDDCEADPARADLVNGEAVGFLQRAAERVGAHLTTISTDYVFDGTSTRPYVEVDRPNPLSAYGRSKLLGEHRAGPSAALVRTSWVAGRSGKNTVRTVLRLLDAGRELRFVDDQVGHLTLADDLAGAVADLSAERAAGTYHVTNDGAASWYDIARLVAELGGFDPDRVQPCATSELDPPRPAPRPRNSRLDNRRWREEGREPLPPHDVGLRRLVAAWS